MNIGTDPYKVRVTLLNGIFFTAALNIQFGAWLKAIKADGFIQGQDMFVPYKAIAMIVIDSGATQQEFKLSAAPIEPGVKPN